MTGPGLGISGLGADQLSCGAGFLSFSMFSPDPDDLELMIPILSNFESVGVTNLHIKSCGRRTV